MKIDFKNPFVIGGGLLLLAASGILGEIFKSAIKNTVSAADDLVGEGVQTAGSLVAIPRTDTPEAKEKVRIAMDANDSAGVADNAPLGVYLKWLAQGRPKADGSPNNLTLAKSGFAEATGSTATQKALANMREAGVSFDTLDAARAYYQTDVPSVSQLKEMGKYADTPQIMLDASGSANNEEYWPGTYGFGA